METIELKVAGMTCGGCEASVTRALSRIAGVSDVKADHASGTVLVSAEGAVAREDLARAVEDAGYDVVPEGQKRLPLV